MAANTEFSTKLFQFREDTMRCASDMNAFLNGLKEDLSLLNAIPKETFSEEDRIRLDTLNSKLHILTAAIPKITDSMYGVLESMESVDVSPANVRFVSNTRDLLKYNIYKKLSPQEFVCPTDSEAVENSN